MKSFLLFLSYILSASLAAQVVTCDPAIPTLDHQVTITFHADLGNKGLMGYTGDDVYAHTGVITDKSSSSGDWKHVKATWTTNTAACKMTRTGTNEYSLTISPSIREFYGITADEKVLKMAFVFRNSNAGQTGRDINGADIFVNVYAEGLQVSFLQPATRFSFVEGGQQLTVEASANEADSLFLSYDGIPVTRLSRSYLDTSLEANDHQRHELVITAHKGNQSTADTVWFMVAGATLQEILPEGIKDGITYAATDSVIFTLFAPGKNNIYLIGDFNNWLPDSSYQLKKDGDRFWTSLGHLNPGKKYAFQYIVDETLLVADPYSEEILDPANDKDVKAPAYPDLMPYPEGKTTEIAGVIQPGKIPYLWNDTDYVAPSYQNLTIYELLIRDFVSTHDIKDVEAKLDYIQTLGINAIELMPFSEFDGNSSWGYNPTFYFAPDKYYGRDQDYKDFISACHSRGIAVIMDMVLNHSWGQSPMVRLYFNSGTGKVTAANPWYNVDSPNSVYSWGYDFNHESTATQYFVDRVIEYWLNDYKIDGFRFDFTKGFTNTPGDGSAYDASRINILKRIYDKVKSVNPDAYMICEHFAPNDEEKELSDYGMMLWGNSNYTYNEATMGYLENSDFSNASYLARNWTNPSLVSYMESHDEERLMYKNITYGNVNGDYNVKDLSTALKRMELAGAFFFTIPGPKMIWQFGELGYDISIDYNGRVEEKPIHWDYWNNADRQHLYLIWAKLIDLRKKYAVFQTNDFSLSVGNNIATRKIILRHPDGDAIVVGNFGLINNNMQPGFTQTGWWHEVFTGDSINVTALNQTISLEAGEYRIYTAQKMESVINGSNNIIYEPLLLYPNPVTSILNFGTIEPGSNLEILSVSGQLIHRTVILNNMADVSRLPAGFYIARITTPGKILIAKFIKQDP